MTGHLDYDQLAAEYARHRQVHPGVLRGLSETAGLGAGARVLEIGCGTGNYSLALAELTGAVVTGIDPSARMLAQARARSSAISFLSGRAEHLPLPDASVDLVFSVDVIHHVADRRAFFAEAARVLVPGGRLCTVTDSAEIIRQRCPLSVYFPETVEPELRRYPPVAELRALMTAAGFTDLTEHVVERHYDLTDASAYRDRAYSSLHLIDPAAFAHGLARLEADLRLGPIPCVSRYLLLWGQSRLPEGES
jgi:ubiquinone/menaquinone biosynthesis C-methylase UbiE